ncbi:MAG: hypothetical protein ABSB97_05500 [Thermoplasmata archaeon]|jgi:hypothetical protein
MYRTLRVCSNSGAFEAVPDSSRPVDLVRVRRHLEQDGIAVVDARVMLIAALEVEVTISRTGRLLFKTRDEKTAQRCFDRLRPLLGLEASPAAPESRGAKAGPLRPKGSG